MMVNPARHGAQPGADDFDDPLVGPSLGALVAKVREWAKDRGIFESSDPKSQMLKTVEEVGELADAIAKEDREEIQDAIGDIIVTLVLQAEMQGLDVRDCLGSAYGVISKRSGKMVNGVFVKDQ